MGDYAKLVCFEIYRPNIYFRQIETPDREKKSTFCLRLRIDGFGLIAQGIRSNKRHLATGF
jgi:hypothetical protein